jgi:hypothetical protein
MRVSGFFVRFEDAFELLSELLVRADRFIFEISGFARILDEPGRLILRGMDE